MPYEIDIAGASVKCDTVGEVVELITTLRQQNGNVGMIQSYLEKSGNVHLATIMRSVGLTKGQTSYALRQGAALGLFEQKRDSLWGMSKSKVRVRKT